MQVASRIGQLALSVAFISLAPPRAHPVEGPTDPAVADTAPAELPVEIAPRARGLSGALRVQVAMPGEVVDFPLRWTPGAAGAPQGGWYRWIPLDRRDAASRRGGGSQEKDDLLGAPVRGSGPRAALNDGPFRLVAGAGASYALLPGGELLDALGRSASSPLPDDHRFLAPFDPGVYELEVGAGALSRRLADLRLVVQVPFERKRDGRIDGYVIGRYPTEGSARRDRYAPPAGFIRVPRELKDLPLSEHFRLGQFLTKDQSDVWPKYVVVSPLLLEKLELVIQELRGAGVRADRMAVMSGFRTPRYNGRGLEQGRADLSRHQWGDAADVWVDNEGDWYMSDLNGDGRRDTADARVMLRAVERVEARFPELRGGAGVYPDNGAHGPFLHIDTRGTPARW